jgi:hypothetical protein
MSTTTHEHGSGPARPALPPVPPLQLGEHLTADEFERRYDAMPELKKAELIEGIVYMGSPVSIDDHAEPDSDVATWLGVYKAYTPGTQTGCNATVRLDNKNRPQRGEQQYERLAVESGICKSRVFPGLWLDADALIAGNMAHVLAVLQQGLASTEHAAFCEELERRRGELAASHG